MSPRSSQLADRDGWDDRDGDAILSGYGHSGHVSAAVVAILIAAAAAGDPVWAGGVKYSPYLTGKGQRERVWIAAVDRGGVRRYSYTIYITDGLCPGSGPGIDEEIREIFLPPQ